MINEEQIKTSKETITKSVNNLVDVYFNCLSDVLEDIEEGKKQLTSITLEYSQVSQQIEKSKKELESQRLETTKGRAKLLEDIQEFKNSVEFFEGKKIRINKDIDLLSTAKSKLEEDIKYLTQTLENMEMQTKSKNLLSKELEDVRIALEKDTKALNEAKEEYGIILHKTQKIVEDEQSILALLKKEIEDKRKIVIPTIEELDARAKVLDEKEEGLKIIEARYKKLYGEHGANFKV